MKFIIAVDCEGPSCVVGTPGKALSDSRDYRFACTQATLETNACIRALFDSGAEQVFVWDGHGQGINLNYRQLDPRCRVILGKGFDSRFPGLDASFSGVLMIGYHAMEGTESGVLAHTYSSESYRQIRVNGMAAGEITLDASVAGELGVPLIFLASDSKGCLEGRSAMPWIKTVTTKTGMGRNCAICKHPDRVIEEIYSTVQEAVAGLKNMQPFTFEKPIQVTIEFKTVLQTLKALVYRRWGWHPAGFRTIRKELTSMLDWNC